MLSSAKDFISSKPYLVLGIIVVLVLVILYLVVSKPKISPFGNKNGGDQSAKKSDTTKTQQNFQQPVPQPTFQQPVPQQTFQQPVPQPTFQQPVPQQTFQQPVPQQTFQQPVPQQPTKSNYVDSQISKLAKSINNNK